MAEEVIEELKDSFDAPIVTEVSPLAPFYEAEEYHQNYSTNTPRQGYCSYVISPKINKLRKLHADKLGKA